MDKKISINGHPFMSYEKEMYEPNELLNRAKDFYYFMNKRRTVRDFSDRPIEREVIENLLLTASSAPSGAHKQPWTFCVVSNPEIKKKIRIAAEEEEKISYESRMNEEWKNDLAALQTNWEKPFLEIAPYLIIVFSKSYSVDENQNKQQNYYVKESCGIACGILLTAIHHAGLAALTHTPSPMNFLNKILDRPQNEKPFLLIPVGYLAKDCFVPCLERKPLYEISAWY
ncbi:MAG: nitroreductase family protein [Bacteroidia bacterium]